MKKRTFKRLAAALLTGAMMVGMMGATVCAEGTVGKVEGANVTAVTLTKNVAAESNVLAPNETFSFNVEPVGADTTKIGSDNKTVVVYNGVPGGALFETGKNEISFDSDSAFTKTTTVKIDSGVFKTPGVYRYKVTEVKGENDGMTYSEDIYFLDLYVEYADETTEPCVVKYVEVLKDADTDIKSNLDFTNTYATNNLTLTKVVTGNQADMTSEYKFTITIGSTNSGEKFAATVTDAEGNKTEKTLVVGSNEVTLGHNDSITIYGLSAKDTYTIVEDDTHLDDGYTTTITGTADEKNDDTLTASGKCDTGDDSVTYTNDKSVNTPTGIITTFAPYILMVAFAAVVAFFFLRRRSREF